MAREAFPDPETVSTRKEFAAYIELLCADFRDHPDEWENATLENFLEALSAYVQDVPGYVKNAQLSLDPEQASWQLFALVLAGARAYE